MPWKPIPFLARNNVEATVAVLEPVKKVSEKACTDANGLLQGLGCSTESDTRVTSATGMENYPAVFAPAGPLGSATTL